MSTNKIWKKTSEELYNAGTYRRLLKRTFLLPNGVTDFYDIKKEPNYVSICAFTSNNQALLVKQYRPGPEEFTLECPAGNIEKHETPKQSAAKELLEETGYTGHITSLAVTPACGYSTAKKHHFIATNCVPVQEIQNESENEFIERMIVPISELKQLLRNGAILQPDTCYMALQHLNLL